MKRLIPLFLLLAVLTTACVREPSVTIESQTEATTEAPTEEPTVPAETLPSGISVKTDYSAYTQRETASAKYTHLSETFTNEFVPSNDYGMIYPFVGAEIYDEYGSISELYGIIDENGRILVDPVYSVYHSICEYRGNDLVCYPFFAFGKTTDLIYSCGVTEAAEMSADLLYAIISLDGSFATDCIYYRVYASGGYIIGTRKNGDTLAFDIFDTDGQVVLSSADLPLHDRFSGSSGVEYSDGVLTVGLKTGEFHEYTDEHGDPMEQYDIYLMDMEGNLLCGPYGKFSTPYRDGYAIVEVRDNVMQIIDRNGQPISDREFDYASNILNGYCVVSDTGSVLSYVLDTQGNAYLREEEFDYLYWDGTYFRAENSSRICFYDASFRKIREERNENCYPLGNSLFLAYEDNFGNTQKVVNPDGKAYICTAKNAYFSIFESDDSTILCADEFIDGVWHYKLMDGDFRTLSEGEGSPYQLRDLISDDFCIVVRQSGTTFYDMAGKGLFELPISDSASLSLIDGRCMVTDAFTCSLYDADGTLVFRYPLLSATGD